MVRFGIIGAGNIARKFRQAVALTEGAEVIAVAAKELSRAEKWAAEMNVARAYGSYDALLADADIDAVYIATTNNFHYENIRAALLAGKNVLCEKSMVGTRAQADELFALADRQKRLLMEGMWSRFLPKTQAARRWIADGRIGEIAFAHAALAFVAAKDNNGRMYSPALGGGALWDLGVYPLEIMSYLLNEKICEVQSLVRRAETGVDLTVSLNIRYETCFAGIQMSFNAATQEDAVISGDRGYIVLPHIHWGNEAFLYNAEGELVDQIRDDCENAFIYEVREVVSLIEAGALESTIASRAMTRESCDVYDLCLQSER